MTYSCDEATALPNPKGVSLRSDVIDKVFEGLLVAAQVKYQDYSLVLIVVVFVRRTASVVSVTGVRFGAGSRTTVFETLATS